MRKILNLTLAIAMFSITFAKPAIADELQKQQILLQYIANEEAKIQAEQDKIDKLNDLLFNSENEKAGDEVVLTSSSGVVVFSLVSTIISGTAFFNGFKKSKILFIVSGVVLATASIIAIKSGYKVQIKETELKKLQVKKEEVQKNLQSLRDGLNLLKSKLGIDLRELNVNVNTSDIKTVPLIDIISE